MKKLFIGIGSVVAVIALIGMMFAGSYNGLVSKKSDVGNARSKIETALQRRYDLIPNVVASVKGYMSHESEVFESIANARSKIGSANVTDTEKIKAEGELSSAISRLLVLTENYPQLKADQHVQSLITELEGSENRVFVARNDYNAVATDYNKKVKSFPTVMIAGMFGFTEEPLFQADTAAQTAPKVDLSK